MVKVEPYDKMKRFTWSKGGDKRSIYGYNCLKTFYAFFSLSYWTHYHTFLR